VLETLACGRPVVATRVGGIPELITSDEFGYLVPPRDVTALAAALRAALEREWSPEAVALRAQGCSWQDNACLLHEQLKTLVATL